MSGERLRRLSDQELGAALRRVRPSWPHTPPLEAIVAERIREAERAPRSLRPRLSLPSRRRTVAILVATLLALAAVAVAAKLAIDIGAVTVQTLPGVPGSLPPETGPAFGERVSSIEEAAARAGFEVALPATLGPPDRIWVGRALPDAFALEPTSRVVLAWDPKTDLPPVDGLPWGAVLMEFPGEATLASKSLYEDSGGVFRPVSIDGRDGFWITGEHVLSVSSDDEDGVQDLRVTGNVLVWQRGDVTFRLETALGLEAATDLAASIRPG